MTLILENPVFTYKKILEENCKPDPNHWKWLTEEFIHVALYHESLWISCKFRIRNETGKESGCMNIHHPKFNNSIIFIPRCCENECKLPKHVI